RVVEHRTSRLPHHVDETRGDDQSHGLDDPLTGRSFDPANSGDLAAANTDIGHIPRRAAAIDYAATLDHDFVRLLGDQRTAADGAQADDASAKKNGTRRVPIASLCHDVSSAQNLT